MPDMESLREHTDNCEHCCLGQLSPPRVRVLESLGFVVTQFTECHQLYVCDRQTSTEPSPQCHAYEARRLKY